MEVERTRQRERAAQRGARAGPRGMKRARPAAVDRDQAHASRLRRQRRRLIRLQRQLVHAVARRGDREGVAELVLVERAHAGLEALLVERGHDPDELLGARLEREHHAHAVAAVDLARGVAALIQELERLPVVAEAREHAARLRAVLELGGPAHPSRARPARHDEPGDLLRPGCSDRRAGRRHPLVAQPVARVLARGRLDVLALHPHRPALPAEPARERLRDTRRRSPAPASRRSSRGSPTGCGRPARRPTPRRPCRPRRRSPRRTSRPARPRPCRRARRSTGRSGRRSAC